MSPSPGFASLHPGYLIPQVENARTFRRLVEKHRIMAALSQLPWPRIKQRAEKNLVGSEGWLSSAECLEFAPGGELKKIKLAHQGALREAICGVE
jgi:hypothetical protein